MVPDTQILDVVQSVEDRQGLLDAARQASPYCGLPWFEHLAATGLPPQRHARFLVLREQGRALGCLPLTCEHADLRGKVESLSTYYSTEFGPIWPAERERDLCRQAAQALKSASSVSLRPVEQDSLFFKEMQQALKEAGFWVDSHFCHGNWYLEVAGRSYEAYLAGLTSNIRKNMARRVRKLADHQSMIRIVTDEGPDLEWAIQAYEGIYRLSWKRPEPFPDFIPGMCRLMARQGYLRLGVLTIGDLPIAAQLWVVKDGMASIYKLAYAEEYAKLSAGTVLTAELMRRVIDEDKVSIVDYGIGDDPYKKDWMSHRREYHGILAFNSRSPAGWLGALKHFGGQWLKPLLKRVRGSEAAEH